MAKQKLKGQNRTLISVQLVTLTTVDNTDSCYYSSTGSSWYSRSQGTIQSIRPRKRGKEELPSLPLTLSMKLKTDTMLRRLPRSR